MLVVLLANLVNFAANWVLVFGHWGAPGRGIVGSAWATALSRWRCSRRSGLRIRQARCGASA
jgi:MATE family multidrug resistance protein